MTEARGHRVVDHTADEILEAGGPSRAACLEEAVLGFVALSVAETEDAVPAAVRVDDGTEQVAVTFDLAPVGDGDSATGPPPKGIALSGLRLADEDGRWYARALVDV